MIDRLVLFGATGDLAGRFLLPALASLYEAGKLSKRFRIVAAAQSESDDEAFRKHVREKLDAHAEATSQEARAAVINAVSYRQADIGDPASVATLLDGPAAIYLALPNRLFSTAIRSIGRAGLPAGSRIVVEKPFGTDLEDAIALNDLLAGIADESSMFRVDHALGMPTVRNLLPLRSNDVLMSLWNSEHIESIEVLWEETLALEGRAAYYDHAGALKDVMQNHMLQVLTRLTMELPDDSHDVHNRGIGVLRAVRPFGIEEMSASTRRGRYEGYTREEGVDPARGTETFAEVELSIDNRRWKGTRIVMRAGKAMARRRKEAVIHFRDESSRLRIGIDDPNDIQFQLGPTTFVAPPPPSDLPAYGHVLSNILEGRNDLSVSAEEAVESWRIFMPVLDAWRENLVPLEEYPSGATALSPRELPRREAGHARPRAEQ